MDVITDKLKEVLMSVLPIVAIVLILNFSLVPLTGDDLARFLFGSGLIILGLTLFLFGVDAGITPIGVRLGGFLARSNRLFILVIVGLILGFLSPSLNRTCISWPIRWTWSPEGCFPGR